MPEVASTVLLSQEKLRECVTITINAKTNMLEEDHLAVVDELYTRVLYENLRFKCATT